LSGAWIGVITGLLAAFFSALSYLVSRHHVLSHPELEGEGGGPRLIVQSHVLMGLACIPACLLLWPRGGGPAAASYLPPACLCAVAYLIGQSCFFTALREVPASRLAPLLGLKIAMLAGIVALVLGPPLGGRQWAAVALSVVAALALQRGDDRLPARALGLILVACLCFAIADLAIVSLIGRLAGDNAEPMGRFHAGVLAMAITYVACGAILLPAAPRMWPRSGGGWLPAVQYSLVWLLAMIALYACLGQVGAVFGNILQSTRGVMSVVIGAALAHAGWHDLEEQVDRATLLKRIAAAMLMTAAIALWVSDVS
jgi:drug/metabolite transporter (DMT)-like permease